MNAAGTMARVYHALKARVMAGEFAPGERIDPARLSVELAASATPIRDALHRLAGERLVESWQHEGFRQPLITEAGLRDLYGWAEDLLHAILRAAARAPGSPVGDDVGDRPIDVASAFIRAAQLSPNHEHRLAMIALNERCSAIRQVETKLFPDQPADIADLLRLLDERRWSDLRRWNTRYHATRIRRVADVAAGFKRRQP